MELFGKSLKLLIVDVDGVVLDLFASYTKVLTMVAEEMGLPLDAIDRWHARHRDGTLHGNPRFKKGIKTDLWPHITDEDAEKFYWRFRELEEKIGYPEIPGSIKTIQWFRERSVRVALCTMNDERAISWKLHSINLRRDMLDFVCTREVANADKPDPAILRPIFEAIPVSLEEACYVGDWYADIEVAHAAKIRFIAVLSGEVPRHAFLKEGVPDDHIISKLSDLKALVVPR